MKWVFVDEGGLRSEKERMLEKEAQKKGK